MPESVEVETDRELAQSLEVIARMIETAADIAMDQFGSNTHQPSATSRAVADLAQQRRFAMSNQHHPVDDIWTQTHLALSAADDGVRTLAASIQSSYVPLFTGATIVRAACEAFALAYYLCDPAIGIAERIRRSVNLRLEGIQRSMRTLAASALPPDSEENVNKLVRYGERLGFEIGGRRSKFVKPSPPTKTDLMDQLFDGEYLGKVIYHFTSGIAHAEPAMLMTSGDRSKATWGADGRGVMPLVKKTSDYQTLAFILILAQVQAIGRYATYRGHSSTAWDEYIVETLAQMGPWLEAESN